MDLKNMYQEKAEEIAITEHSKELDELDEETQDAVYGKAEVLVHEDLQSGADNLRKGEIRMENPDKIELDGCLIEIDTENKRARAWFDDESENEISRDIPWSDLVKLSKELSAILKTVE